MRKSDRAYLLCAVLWHLHWTANPGGKGLEALCLQRWHMARLLWWGCIQEYTTVHGWYRGTWRCCFAVFKDVATKSCCGWQHTKVTWQSPKQKASLSERWGRGRTISGPSLQHEAILYLLPTSQRSVSPLSQGSTDLCRKQLPQGRV